MKKIFVWIALIITAVCAVIISCKKDTEELRYNKSPVASAGPDRTLTLPKDSVVLNGTASYDPDGIIAKYQWTKLAGPSSFSITNAETATAVLQSLVKGIYQMELTVTDNGGAYAKDTVRIIVHAADDSNQPPVAHAGADQIITLPVSSTTLDGSTSNDPDGIITAYQWSKVAGPFTFSFQSPLSAQTGVNALVEGVYLFELAVTDDGKLTAKDTVQVTVKLQGTASCDVSDRPRVNAQLTEVGKLSVARAPYVAAAGNKIVFAGGLHDYRTPTSAGVVDIYDVTDGSWTKTNLSQGRIGIAAVSAGNKIFFAGGHDGANIFDDVDIYDVATGKWSLAHLSEPRTELAAAAVGNKVFFAGGLNDDLWGQSNRVDIYDIPSGQWTQASLTHAKYGLTAVTAGNKIYFAAGWDWLGNNGAFKDIDIYDAATQGWTRSSFVEISGGVSGIAVGDHIYWGGIAPQNTGKAEIWSAGNATTACLASPRVFPTAVAKNNEIVFFTPGAWILNDKLDNRFDIYNTLTGKWTVGLLPQSMNGVAVITVNNTIYMAGGFIDNRTCTDKVYKLSW
jgi:N-acetylneuraminic acid mutarotase